MVPIVAEFIASKVSDHIRAQDVEFAARLRERTEITDWLSHLECNSDDPEAAQFAGEIAARLDSCEHYGDSAPDWMNNG